MTKEMPRVVVVNFNSPELNFLAIELARQGRLARFVRPYVNKGRGWERALERMPLGGGVYARTFGRRRLPDPALARFTREAGVLYDWCSAIAGRSPWLPERWRHGLTNGLHRRVRASVAREGRRAIEGPADVVGYEGFAQPAFEAARARGARTLLDYPVAHHRRRRAIRDEELERQPAFAATWPGFDDWGPGHEERLDCEIELADAVLLGSQFAADSFAAAGIDRAKLRIVPYGVDHATFRPPAVERAPDARFQVIYAGQLTQRKGLSYLLRGYRMFRRADTELTMVGSPVGGTEPLRPYAELFTHVPHQTRGALAERYRAADVFLFPTLVEGMPLVVLEAMACGLPVIVTANGPGGIVRHGVDGLIIEERSDEAVAQALEDLYRDPERRRAMGRAAAERAREFGWPVYARRVLAVLDEARGGA